MSDWTLGSIKAHNMEIIALCEAEGCQTLYAVGLDPLIAELGADYTLASMPPLGCPACGAMLQIRLSFADPSEDGD
jgi:hypothetical protein